MRSLTLSTKAHNIAKIIQVPSNMTLVIIGHRENVFFTWGEYDSSFLSLCQLMATNVSSYLIFIKAISGTQMINRNADNL